MIARIICRVSLWIGIVAALAILFVAPLYYWFNPPGKPVLDTDSLWDVFAAALHVFGSITDGIVILVWIVGLSATALLASLVAFAAAWYAGEPQRTKWLCGLPGLVMALEFGILVAIDA